MVLLSILNDVATDDEDLSSNSEDGEEDEFGDVSNEESDEGDDEEEDESNEEDNNEGDESNEEDNNEEDESMEEDNNEEDESEEEENDEEDDEPPHGDPESEDETVGNSGWADAMAKVLAIGKNSTKPVSVLSKAKKGNSKKAKVKASDGEDSSSGSEAEPVKKLEPLSVRRAKKKEIDSIGRIMPNVLERNSERILSKTATRGVVQLFNAVRDHQKDVKTKLKDAGGSFRKQEKVYKNLDKNSFMEMLSGKSMSNQRSGESQPPKKQKLERDNSTNSQSSWSILREDYMLGAKMKDWDRESDEET